MSEQRSFPAVARQLSIAGLIAMLYVISVLLNGTPAPGFPVALYFYSAAIWLFNRLFMRHPRTVAQIAVFNFLIAAAFFAALLLTGSFSLPWQVVYGVISVIIVTSTGIDAAVRPVKLNGILLLMDANILLLIFSALVISSLPHSYSWTVFAIAGALFGLLGSISLRLKKSFGKREWGILLILFLLIAVIAWLLFAFVVSPLSTGVADLGQGIASFFVFLGDQFTRFFRFLASLWHDDTEPAELGMEPLPSYSGEETMGEVNDNGILPILLIGVILIAAVVVLILLFRRTRKNRVKREKYAVSAKAVEVKKTSFRRALEKLIEKIRRRIRTGQFLSASGNRPEGIYFKLKKICRKTTLKEQPGDTPAEFLLRIRNEMPEDAANIDELIKQLNLRFYAEHSPEVSFSWAKDFLSRAKKRVLSQ